MSDPKANPSSPHQLFQSSSTFHSMLDWRISYAGDSVHQPANHWCITNARGHLGSHFYSSPSANGCMNHESVIAILEEALRVLGDESVANNDEIPPPCSMNEGTSLSLLGHVDEDDRCTSDRVISRGEKKE